MNLRTTSLLLLVVVGCNSDTTSTNQPEANDDKRPSAAAKLQQLRQAEQFTENLTELNRIAEEKEAKLQFSDAATVWGQVRQLVSNQFGDKSWQALNARLAYENALVKSKFSEHKCNDFRQTQKIVDSITIAVKERDFENALQLSHSLLTLTSDLYGEDSSSYARTLVQSATLENRLGKYASAAKRLHQAIELFRKHDFGDHPEVETSHAALASAYMQQSKLTPAAANQKEATRMAGIIWGRESLNFANQANQLGVIYHRAGNLEVAFEILDRARKIRESQLGTDHVLYAHSCLNMGVLMLDLNRSDNAEVYLKNALAIFERDFGTKQSLTNRTKSYLATIYMLQQKPELAEPLLRSIVNSLPAESNDHLTHSYRLSVAYARQGKYQIAKPIMETVIKKQKQKFGSADQRTVDTMKAYAMLLERTDQTEAASTIKQHINRVAQQVETSDFQKRY